MDLKKLKSSYDVTVSHRRPDFTESSMQARVSLTAIRERKKGFKFTLLQREVISINMQEPEQVMDLLMISLGNALYPIEFMHDGQSLSLCNFEQVRASWFKQKNELLRKNNTAQFAKYLKMSEANFKNETNLLKVLMRDSFIQFYFAQYGADFFELDCINFPIAGTKESYFAKHNKKVGDYSLIPSFYNPQLVETGGRLKYSRFGEGDIETVSAEISLVTNEGERYLRHVNIKADLKSRKVSHGLFLF